MTVGGRVVASGRRGRIECWKEQAVGQLVVEKKQFSLCVVLGSLTFEPLWALSAGYAAYCCCAKQRITLNDR